MLKELNSTFSAMCAAMATTAKAVEDGSKILRIKGASAKQTAALEAVKAIAAATKDCSEAEIKAATELLSLIED